MLYLRLKLKIAFAFKLNRNIYREILLIFRGKGMKPKHVLMRLSGGYAKSVLC